MYMGLVLDVTGCLDVYKSGAGCVDVYKSGAGCVDVYKSGAVV